MKREVANIYTGIAYRRYKQFVVIGIIATIIIVFIGFYTFYNSSYVTSFDITSFIAALISIEVGVLALAYAWYVNKESAAQLNEIQEKANIINENNRNIKEQAATYFDKLHKAQMEILEAISAMQLRNSYSSSSGAEHKDLEKEYQKRMDMLKNLNKEGNTLHELFLNSLH